MHRCSCLVSDMFKFHFEIEKLREILLSNGYSNKFIDKCISKFMHKFLKLQKPVTLTVPKKQLYLVLPLMGKMSALVKSGLIRSLHERLPFSNVKIVFKTSNRFKNYFSFKDIVLEPLRSCQIYNFKIIFKTSNRFKNYFSFKLFLNLYVFAKFIIFLAEAAMLHILVKPSST